MPAEITTDRPVGRFAVGDPILFSPIGWLRESHRNQSVAQAAHNQWPLYFSEVVHRGNYAAVQQRIHNDSQVGLIVQKLGLPQFCTTAQQGGSYWGLKAPLRLKHPWCQLTEPLGDENIEVTVDGRLQRARLASPGAKAWNSTSGGYPWEFMDRDKPVGEGFRRDPQYSAYIILLEGDHQPISPYRHYEHIVWDWQLAPKLYGEYQTPLFRNLGGE